jgi:phosphopantothenoylcysteine decarboxylase/phosphopantothenate--cysteine ligase
VSQPDAGFEVDTNRAVMLESSGAITETPLLSKAALADLILDRVAARLGRGAA